MAPGPAQDQLIERERELAQLRDAVDRAVAGEGALAIIRGDAGIGKSCLCAVAAEMAGGAGLRTFSGRGGELEQDLTYGLVRQLLERPVLDAPADERSRLLEGQAGLAGIVLGLAQRDERPATGADIDHAVFWLTCNLIAAGPLALVVDDAHWADEESLRFLLYLARRMEGLGLLIVVSARIDAPHGQRRALDLLAHEPGALSLEPSPLTERGAARLICARLGRRVPDELVRACRDVSGGTPFYLTEIAGELSDAVELDAAAVARVRSLAPPAVSRSVLLRLGRHEDAVVAAAAALAVLGEATTSRLVAATAGIEPAAAVDALAQLARAGIAEHLATALAHPIIRTAIYLDLPAARRSALHAAAGAALIAAGATAEEIAHHLALSEPCGDERTVAILRVVAARALAQDAPANAARLLERALREPPQDDERAEVLVALGEAELAAGETAGADEHLRAAQALGPEPGLFVRAVLARARALAAGDGFPAAIELLADAATGDDLSGEHRLVLEAEQAALSLYLTDHAAQAQRRMRTLASLPGTTPTERLALAIAALAIGFDADACAGDAAPVAQRALADGALIAELGSEAPPFGNACYVLLFGELYPELESQMERASFDARARGSAFGFMTFSLGGLMTGLLRGELTEAIGHGEAFLARAAEVADTPVVRRWVSSGARFQIEALLEIGDVEGARALLDRMDDGAALDSAERGMLRYGRGLVAERDGDAGTAAAEFAAYGEICRIAGYEDRTTPWRLGAARALAGLGRTAEATALADEAVRIAARWGTPGGLGAAQHTRALIGDPARTCERLTASVATLERSAHRLAHARALIDLGFALRARGLRRDARARLQQGMELAARCEAEPLVGRARAELHTLGARPRRLMFSGLESLTASERRVAGMAAQGLSNRDIAQALFVTPKTIETHLRSVYRKLDIASRRQLPAGLAA